MKTHKGFTLIELLVVIAVVSLLSSVIYASVSTGRVRAAVAASQVQKKGIVNGIEIVRATEALFASTTNTDETVSLNDMAVAVSEIGEILGQENYANHLLSGFEGSELVYLSDATYAHNNHVYFRCGPPATGDTLPDTQVIYFKSTEDNATHPQLEKLYMSNLGGPFSFVFPGAGIPTSGSLPSVNSITWSLVYENFGTVCSLDNVCESTYIHYYCM